MKYCTICGKELQDDMQFCSSCGARAQMSNNEFSFNETIFEKTPTPKKKHKRVITIIIIFFILAGVVCLYSYGTSINTYNKFAELYNTMVEGSKKTEEVNILVINVWQNCMFQISDAQTDKYTKSNISNGQFYADYNSALAILYCDQGYIDNITDIYALQREAEKQIKDLAKHPKSFDEEYLSFKEFYNLFVRFTDLPITAKGNLYLFMDNHIILDKEVANKLKELDIYFK